MVLLRYEVTHCEPHGVAETELIDQDLLLITAVRIVPLIRAESEDNNSTFLLLVIMRFVPGQDEQEDGDDEVGKDHVYPHI
jgi:hypothetical protein